MLSFLVLVAVSCARNEVDVDRLLKNYAEVTIPAPDLTGITDNGKEVLRLYRMAADEVVSQILPGSFMPGLTTVLGTASMGSPSFRDMAASPTERVSIPLT